MLDQLEEVKVDEETTATTLAEGHVWVPPGIYTFAQFETVREAQQTVEDMRDKAAIFRELSDNIIYSDLPDKASAIRELAEEFSKIIDPESAETSAPMEDASESVEEEGVPVEAVEANMAEAAAGSVIEFKEAESANGPVILDVAIIEPGWGNAKHNHYYPEQMLRESAHLFAGAKMYETNHRPEETSNRTWVSTVLESGTRFSEAGHPIARVGIHDPVFAQKVRNLRDLGILDKLNCSILATGAVSKQTFQEDGRTGRRVINIDQVKSVDWVTSAGAGGHAVAVIAEADLAGGDDMSKDSNPQNSDEAPLKEAAAETEVVLLAEADVAEVLGNSTLPAPAQKRLANGKYQSQSDLKEAIEHEIEYIKAFTNAGAPVQFTEAQQESEPKQLTESEADARFDEINRRFGLV